MLTARSARASSETSAVNAAFTGAIGYCDLQLTRRHLTTSCSRAVPHADWQHERQQRHVIERQPVDLEAAVLDDGAEAARGVSPHFLREYRMLAVQDVERRHMQEEPAARLQHARDLGDGRSLDPIGQGLKDVERGDEIERAAAKRDVGDARLRHGVTVRLRKLRAGGGQIEAHRPPVAPQHLEIRSGAAPAIENARRVDAGHGARERGFHVLPETTKPEVRLLRSVRQRK